MEYPNPHRRLYLAQILAVSFLRTETAHQLDFGAWNRSHPADMSIYLVRHTSRLVVFDFETWTRICQKTMLIFFSASASVLRYSRSCYTVALGHLQTMSLDETHHVVVAAEIDTLLLGLVVGQRILFFSIA